MPLADTGFLLWTGQRANAQWNFAPSSPLRTRSSRTPSGLVVQIYFDAGFFLSSGDKCLNLEELCLTWNVLRVFSWIGVFWVTAILMFLPCSIRCHLSIVTVLQVSCRSCLNTLHFVLRRTEIYIHSTFCFLTVVYGIFGLTLSFSLFFFIFFAEKRCSLGIVQYSFHFQTEVLLTTECRSTYQNGQGN